MTLTLVCSYEKAAAHLEEEMLLLRLYYKEKDLVVSATRHLKPISQVAENITTITAKEIEEMNAHTVAEVLNRLTGFFVNLLGQDFGSTSLPYIQGSDNWHVLVLVDGVPWNFLSSGAAETNSIPVGIIERIEVIKGPASSAWGSSLGGVVNIITKPVGRTARPAGSIRASYGERNTQDYRVDVSGLAGPAGYYLFAGHQESDGLRSSRYFDNDSFYSKFNIPISDDVDAGLSIGYSEPHIKFGDFPIQDMTSAAVSRTFFGTASLDASLGSDLSLNISFYHFKQKSVLKYHHLGLIFLPRPPGAGFFPYPSGTEFLTVPFGPGFMELVRLPPGVLYEDDTYDEETTGGSGKLVWKYGQHTAVLGVDVDHGKLDQEMHAGSYSQDWGVEPTSRTHPDIERWAVYANDTIVIDSLSITPGIRYDYNSITGSFTSPSLGLTYKLDEDSMIRGSVARGFTIPPLSLASGGTLFIDPNPNLEPEKVWSYQAGAESSALKYCWLKATLFRHDMKNALMPSYEAGYVINKGEIRRQGIELEAETMPIHNFSLLAGFGYVHIKPSGQPETATQPETETTKSYTYNIGVRYDDGESFRAQLFGHYIWWDLDADDPAVDALDAEYHDFIWDLHLNKRIYTTEKTATELFLTAHNIFNGSQYLDSENKNPRRWIEAGVRINF